LSEADKTTSSDIDKMDKTQKDNRELKEKNEELEKRAVEATTAVGKLRHTKSCLSAERSA